MSLLYSGQGRDRIFAKTEIPQPYLKEYTAGFPPGPVLYPDMRERIAFWDKLLQNGAELKDDSLPHCYMSELDQGLYAGMTGSKVGFNYDPDSGWISSMCHPLATTLEDMPLLEIDTENIWYLRYLKQMDIFKNHADDKFGVSHFILIDGLNYLFELRGATNTYYDALERPKFAARILQFAQKLNIFVQDRYFERIGLYRNGTISNLGQWIPGRIVSESVDPFHLADPAFYEDWGKENVEKMLSHYDGGIIHLHSNGHHILPAVAQTKGVKAIALLEDKTAPPPYESLTKLNAFRRDIPLIVFIPIDVFYKKLKEGSLVGNCFYHITGVPDIETGNRIMEEVKEYRAE